jgi:DNA-binding transcriptional ArsR family regulator
MTYAKALVALADPTRRAVYERVVDRPASVSEVAAAVPAVSRPAVSQHLKVLKDAGLVGEERRGTRRIYSADPAALGELRSYLDRLWSEALDGFSASVAEPKERM